jgi:hypothetical protein
MQWTRGTCLASGGAISQCAANIWYGQVSLDVKFVQEVAIFFAIHGPIQKTLDIHVISTYTWVWRLYFRQNTRRRPRLLIKFREICSSSRHLLSRSIVTILPDSRYTLLKKQIVISQFILLTLKTSAIFFGIDGKVRNTIS